MSLLIRDRDAVPPEDWSYEVAGTDNIPAFTISTKNYGLLYKHVVEYCTANQLPVPTEQDVIDYICKTSTVPCYDSDSHQPLINRFTLGLAPIRKSSSCCTEIPVAPIQEESI